MASKTKIKAGKYLELVTRTEPRRRRLPDGRYVTFLIAPPGTKLVTMDEREMPPHANEKTRKKG